MDGMVRFFFFNSWILFLFIIVSVLMFVEVSVFVLSFISFGLDSISCGCAACMHSKMRSCIIPLACARC